MAALAWVAFSGGCGEASPMLKSIFVLYVLRKMPTGAIRICKVMSHKGWYFRQIVYPHIATLPTGFPPAVRWESPVLRKDPAEQTHTCAHTCARTHASIHPQLARRSPTASSTKASTYGRNFQLMCWPEEQLIQHWRNPPVITAGAGNWPNFPSRSYPQLRWVW